MSNITMCQWWSYGVDIISYHFGQTPITKISEAAEFILYNIMSSVNKIKHLANND